MSDQRQKLSTVKRRGRRGTIATAVMTVGALALAGCADDGGGGGSEFSGEVKIGLLQPFTGAAALAAAEIRNGVDLAVEEINSTGGIDGKQLVVDEFDTKLDPATAVSVFTRAVSQAGVVGIVGPYATSEVVAITPISARLTTPFISPTVSTTSVTVGDDKEFVFRSGVVNEDVTRKNIEMAVGLGCEKPALIHDDGGYGVDYRDGVGAQIGEYDLELVGVESMPVSPTDITPQIQSIAAAGADCVFFGGSAGASGGLVIKTMATVGIPLPVIGPDSLITEDARRVAAGAMDEIGGVYAVQALDQEKPKVVELHDLYVETYDSEPVSPFWVSAYDATHLLAAGLRKSGGEGGDALREALESLTLDDYVQAYGGPDAEGGYGPGDHNWNSGDYLISYKVTSVDVTRADIG